MRVIWLLLLTAALPAQTYFPPGVLDSQSQHYSEFLKALHEPSLWELSQRDPKAEAYRFFWLRAFDHPVAIRLVVRTGGSGWVNLRVTSGQGGYAHGRISRYSVSWATKAKTQSWIAAFDQAGFWRLPTQPPDDDVIRLDGAQWIFEAVKNGQYHVVDRWSPDPGDPVRDLGLSGLRLTRLRLRPREIY